MVMEFQHYQLSSYSSHVFFDPVHISTTFGHFSDFLSSTIVHMTLSAFMTTVQFTLCELIPV